MKNQVSRKASVRFAPLALLALAVLTRPIGADVIVASSAFRAGSGGAEFHSDVRILNPGSSPVTVTPTLYDQATGETVTKPAIEVAARTQVAYDNVLASLFGRTLGQGSFGPMRFQSTGTIIVSSSVNNVNACGSGAVSGQWLPGLEDSQATKAGLLYQLAVSGVSTTGYRTNVVFVYPASSGTTTVTAKLRRGDGSLLSQGILGPLGPNGFTQVAVNDGSFPGVGSTTDTNLWLEFTSSQPVLSFASVIANASGDPYAIVALADVQSTPPPPPPPPVVTPVAVTAANFKFTPATIQLTAGKTYDITWTSQDITHQVSAPALGIAAPPEGVSPGHPFTARVSVTADQAGTHPYICTLHTGMTGVIAVSAP
jgi:plastocyanin